MRFSIIAVLGLAGIALGQNPGTDACFKPCFAKAGCDNLQCFCKNQAALDKASCCVSKVCTPGVQSIIGVVSNLVCPNGPAKVPDRQGDACKDPVVGGKRMI
ncbi:hypothetical protein IWX90DRAFT_412048 [Phyllosticta citrichinensis]|uniref:Extracellular membrane protein CFEM domain-containing protein n=1 Tax=Phyllosticta citrichinensis TaxID=1130410 RepID=A0ABR1Y359_9PEZI